MDMNLPEVGLSDTATEMSRAEKVVYDPKKTEHLLALDGANEMLHLFKAELLDEGCFGSAVEGCIGYSIPLFSSF
ncbi:hypothetical protein V6N12_045887 [Hibiscus sabdariffa]|uniref:Uncharacterized protein n=1 Tax=Hibiscus sabdariffa TaxID=183260 RepID=A0ABR2G4Z2_9ROSI